MLKIAIVGGSGYAGGELIRLLHFHPEAEVTQVTSERLVGKLISKAHPNMRGLSKLRFTTISELEPCDVLFLCLPHGHASRRWDEFAKIAPRIIDASADFRLNDEAAWVKWYGEQHPRPELLRQFVYGIPELNRKAIRNADYISGAGCNATVSLLSLYPLFRAGLVELDRTVIDVKTGSSEAGNRAGDASHHPVRSGCLRSFAPTSHRHTAEVEQELNFGVRPSVHFSATSVNLVRGALATSHVFLNKSLTEKEIWQVYREYYKPEPFMRIVKERDGLYRYPEPKLLAGTNYCDVGFELAPDGTRLVVIGAIDNLMKGAAGGMLQCFNLMHGFPEQTALEFPGLHPI